MKKRIALGIGAVAIVALAVAAPIAFAQRSMHGHGGPDGFGRIMMLGRLAHAKEELGLTDDQANQIKAIFETLRSQNAANRQQLHSGYLAIAQTLVNNPNDLAAAQAQLDQQEQAERVMKSNFLAAASKALNVLTPDQRAKLAAKLADHAARQRD